LTGPTAQKEVFMIGSQEAEPRLEDWAPRAENLIPLLQEIQIRYRYLPEPALREVARHLGLPLTDVYHVATFYNCFSLEPIGKHLVQVCLGTACHVRGAALVLDRFLRDLKLASPGTSRDSEFTVRPVRCVGCCALAPVVRVDENTHAHLTQTKVSGLIKRYRTKDKAEPQAAD
jgi:NADH-quinone oxidoreductase subunit E